MARKEFLEDRYFKHLIKTYTDGGVLRPRILHDEGIVLGAPGHGGNPSWIPRELLLIAVQLDRFIDEGGPARWENQGGINGILWTDENKWVPLADIGLSRDLGFYELSITPNVENEAAGGY